MANVKPERKTLESPKETVSERGSAAKKMEELLDCWIKEFANNDHNGFPPSDGPLGYGAFDDLLVELLEKRRKKTRKERRLQLRPSEKWNVIKRLDRDYPKCGLENCIKKLAEKLMKVPPEPSIALRSAASTATEGKRQRLEEAIRFVERPYGADFSQELDWENTLPLVLPHVSEGFRRLLFRSKPTDQTEEKFLLRPEFAHLKPVLASAALLDLWVQYHSWWGRWGKDLAFARWIDGCHNPKFTQELLKIFPLPPDDDSPPLTKQEDQRRRKAESRRWEKIEDKLKLLRKL
jgi:hypothetical protein